jgi:CBS domain-containing protein
MMWDSDCGSLPVLNVEGKVLGMITDRDICMAAATKNRPPSQITVWETITPRAFTCRPTEDVHVALDLMKRKQVRRLPVVDEDGILQGMVSVNDIILQAGAAQWKKAPELSIEDLMSTLKGISAHRVLAAA